MRRVTQEELNEIVRLHGMWLRGEDGGKRANLSGADLSGLDLSGVDLSGALLGNARMGGVDMRGADLSDAYMSRSRLHGADMRGTLLLGTSLNGADMRGADMSDANGSGAMLHCADMGGAILSGTDLRNCYGNRREIQFVRGSRGDCSVTWVQPPEGPAVLQIDLWRFPVTQWAAFTDAGVNHYAPGVPLAWWRENKGYVLGSVAASPAVPYGRPAN